MKRWSWHWTCVLLLAVSLGLGMSLSLVQGSVMAAAMAVQADGAHHGSSGCDGCSGCDHTDTKAGTCAALCASVAHGLMPGEPLPVASTSRAAFELALAFLSGQLHTPDHGPPKILILD
jgi:hypothetical protein